MNGDKDPKTLDLLWNPSDDTLRYQVNRAESRKISKRAITSIIFQIYDPLGLVGPAVVKAKILLQKLWSLNLDWDESLPQDVYTGWLKIYDELFEINKVTIDRYIFTKNYTNLVFHGMCDASELAYGACIYVCSRNINGKGAFQLLCAKSRVAPLKKLSIPRLELSGALLLAELSYKISVACNLQREQWHYWTDSTVTLAWIQSPSDRWKTFVANRVSAIQELTNENWHHIDTKSNPADLISRGASAKELRESSLWWHGPSWLSEDESKWPANEPAAAQAPEQKNRVKTFTLVELNKKCDKPKNFEQQYLKRFSSFKKLIRITAYVLRFVEKCKRAVLSPGSHKTARLDQKKRVKKEKCINLLTCRDLLQHSKL